MGVGSLPETVTRQRRGCDLNPGSFAPESNRLTTQLPSHPRNGRLRLIETFLICYATVHYYNSYEDVVILSLISFAGNHYM